MRGKIKEIGYGEKNMKNGKLKKILSVALVVVLAILAFRLLGVEGVAALLTGGDSGYTSYAGSESDIQILPDGGGETDIPQSAEKQEPSAQEELTVDEDGEYDSKDEVALYIHLYGHLPSNYVTKTKAKKAGWDGGALNRVLPGKSIGGGGYQNLEGRLPNAPGREWKECDIDTADKSSRGAKRIVFSNDGLIYYTDDHYESFELLYGEP